MNLNALTSVGTDLPLTLGKKVVKEQPKPEAVVEVVGKPGLFLNKETGRMSYVPPSRNSSLRQVTMIADEDLEYICEWSKKLVAKSFAKMELNTYYGKIKSPSSGETYTLRPYKERRDISSSFIRAREIASFLNLETDVDDSYMRELIEKLEADKATHREGLIKASFTKG